MDNDDIITIDVSSLDSTYTIDTTVWDTCHISDISLDITDLTSDTIDLDNLTITLNESVEFEDTMPSVAKVEDMCNDYPALRKAYENFKTIYKMVHQDWQGRQDDDDQLPF